MPIVSRSGLLGLEREFALGRALTEDEHAALIKGYGHPRVVAVRFTAYSISLPPNCAVLLVDLTPRLSNRDRA